VLYGVVFYKAARRLNRTHYPVVYVDVDGESAERTLMLGLHKISGSWDNDALKSILETLRNDGAAGDIGFSREDLSRLLDTVKLPEKVRIKSDVKVTVHIGKLRLEIPANKYEEWWLNLCSECGSTNNADVLEYIIKKLGL
jgi:ParB-like chromosome segregation protein Spo0J